MDFLVENIDGIIIVVYCFLIGIILAFITSLITRGIYGKLVDALVKTEADCEVNAKTLSELGIKENPLLVRALGRTTVLSSLISCDDEKLEIGQRHFYILPEHKIKAQSLFGTEKLTPLTIAVAIILLAIIVLLFQYAIPKFIK